MATALLVLHAAYALVDRAPSAAPPLSPAALHLRVDPNRATAAELDLLPRIGPKISGAIITYRNSVHEPPAFRTPEDLDRVPRIGPATVELLRPFLCFPDIGQQPPAEHDTP